MPTFTPSRSSVPGDRVASVLTVVVALAPSFFNGHFVIGSLKFWALLGSGLAFLRFSFIRHDARDSERLTWRIAGSFALQLILLAVILTLTRLGNNSVFAVFPLVGRAMACLSRRVATVFAIVVYVGIVTGSVVLDGRAEGIRFGETVLAGFVFIAAFVRIAVREATARTEAEGLSAKLTEANQQLRSQAEQKEELAIMRERNRLAREIHDSLGHALTTIAVQLEAAGAVHATDPAFTVSAINKAHALAHEALAEVRRSVGTLRQEEEPPSLHERLRQLTTCNGQLSVNLTLLGEPRSLTTEVEHGLFRTAQEGLTNVRRHASARSATLTLDYRNRSLVRQIVADDGRGSVGAPAGFGLQGLRERASLLGGTLVTENRPEGGFMLQLEVPG